MSHRVSSGFSLVTLDALASKRACGMKQCRIKPESSLNQVDDTAASLGGAIF